MPPPAAVARDVRGHALTHEHARACRCLEHVVDALDLQRAALLVRACTDELRDALCLRARHVLLRGGRACIARHQRCTFRLRCKDDHSICSVRISGQPSVWGGPVMGR